MSTNTLISPILKNDKITIFVKESYVNAARNPYARSLFERVPEKDVLKVTEKYNRIPALYDDMLSGKIKIFLKGLSEKADPVFNEKAVTTENFRKMFSPKSLIGYVIKIFDSVDKDKKSINRISMQIKNDRLKMMTFDFEHKAVDQFDLPVLDKENPFIKILNCADDKQVDLYRD